MRIESGLEKLLTVIDWNWINEAIKVLKLNSNENDNLYLMYNVFVPLRIITLLDYEIMKREPLLCKLRLKLERLSYKVVKGFDISAKNKIFVPNVFHVSIKIEINSTRIFRFIQILMNFF